MQSKWDARYGEPGFAYGTAPNDFLASSLSYLPAGGELLCLAEGEGRNSTFLAQHGYMVTAVDSSRVGLEKAEALAKERDVEITTYVADLADFKLLPDRYDGIVSIFCHLPVPVRRQLHAGVAASLRKGGAFLLEAYTPRQLQFNTGGPPTEELLMELDELRLEFPGLDIIRGQELERDIREGRLHTGRGSVVQLIAVRN